MVYDLNIWVALLCIPPMYIIVCTFHELSHGLTLAPYGWKFSITPWPTKRQDMWYFGICEWTEQGEDPPNWVWSLHHMMPRVPNLILIVVSCIWFHNFAHNQIYQTIVAMFGICSFVDCCVGLLPIWWYKERPHTDIWRFYKNTGIDIWPLRLASLAYIAALAVSIFKPA